MEKTKQKRVIDDDFWADVQRGLINFIIIGGAFAISLWLAIIYVAWLN